MRIILIQTVQQLSLNRGHIGGPTKSQ